MRDTLASVKSSVKIVVDVPGKGDKEGRNARVTVRFAKVTLKPPQRNKTAKKIGGVLEPVEVHVVHAVEENPPKNVEPLECRGCTGRRHTASSAAASGWPVRRSSCHPGWRRGSAPRSASRSCVHTFAAVAESSPTSGPARQSAFRLWPARRSTRASSRKATGRRRGSASRVCEHGRHSLP